MKKFPILLFLVFFSPSMSRAMERIELGCAVSAKGGLGSPNGARITNCENTPTQWSQFPYLVPVNKWLCVTDFYLQNKFPWDPPEYGRAMRSVYLEFPGISIPSHHPHLSLRTPKAYPPETLITAYVINSQSEDQNMYVYIFGYLAIDSNCNPNN